MYRSELQDNRTYKALFLLNLLSYKECTRSEIIEEFEKNDITISKSSVINYIEKLISFDIPIKIRRSENGIDYYSLIKQELKIRVDDYDALIARDIKKLLMLEKDHDNIKRAIELFYKFALFTPKKSTRMMLADFGYYSTINWNLMNELQEHCEKKDVIEIDYMLPAGGNKTIILHADEIITSDWSERIYLKGMFYGSTEFSKLPVDRIFMVTRVIEEYVRFDVEINVLTYKIKKELMAKLEFDDQESFSHYEDDLAVIQRPIDDSFALIQRLMYFCPDLYYISDPEIKARVEEKLYALKDIYKYEPDY